jgi:hypothetical protein
MTTRSKQAQYTYKGERYTVKQLVKMKNPATGKWLEAVLYVDSDKAKYVRSVNDFNSKFKRVP